MKMKTRFDRVLWIFAATCLLSVPSFSQLRNKEIPDHLIVLTFDDGPASHYHFVAPVLKKYGFGATFFVCEFPPNFGDSTKYMNWRQISQLDDMGFEIGNHTHEHVGVGKMNAVQFNAQLKYIEDTCKQLHIIKPVSFAYPGWTASPYVIPELKKRGYLFARAGADRAYDPLHDHPYLIPSFDAAGKDTTKVLNFIRQAKDGKIVVLTFHGVPDIEHSWVTTAPELFQFYMKYLYDHHYTVIAMKDLKKYINVKKAISKIVPVFD